jgi:hypothetical protein
MRHDIRLVQFTMTARVTIYNLYRGQITLIEPYTMNRRYSETLGPSLVRRH